MEDNPEIHAYRCLTEFRMPLLEKIISSLSVKSGSKGLDAGCGFGTITKLLSRYGHVTGLDLSEVFIEYAVKYNKTENTDFTAGDINSLTFDKETFDWIWSVDTVWIGPEELGCPAEEPPGILKGFHRVLKPGGILYLLFWSSQKLLPGYPLLEASLNTSSSATAPYVKGMNPDNHIFRLGSQLKKAGFTGIDITTHVMDIKSPLTKNDKEVLNILFRMFWGESEQEMSIEDVKAYNRFCSPDSPDYILNLPDYYGFITYTIIKGVKA
jgi:demethylmenaquinone methyltransferase/2-methoxy-6-polyprenyl-1,4-benzoquinol methylase